MQSVTPTPGRSRVCGLNVLNIFCIIVDIEGWYCTPSGAEGPRWEAGKLGQVQGQAVGALLLPSRRDAWLHQASVCLSRFLREIQEGRCRGCGRQWRHAWIPQGTAIANFTSFLTSLFLLLCFVPLNCISCILAWVCWIPSVCSL